MEIKRTKRDIFTWTFLFSVFTTILITGVCPADAHRIFAVTEYGKVQEIKKGKLQRKVGAAKIADFDSKKPKMIPDPMKFYVYLEDEYDPDEWCVSQIGNNMFLGTYFKTEAITDKKAFQKNSDVKQISEKIIEVTLENKFHKYASKSDIESFNNGQKGTVTLPAIAITYMPNKKKKKAGKQETYWFVGISDYEFDENAVAWTSTQVELSINDIIETKQTNRQLFASIAPPEPVIPDQLIANNSQANIQYVIVQQQPQQIIQQQQVEPIHEIDEIPDSDVDLDIPYSNDKRQNAFAIIIANENYSKVSSVPFAKRDGQKVRDYLIKTLGFEKEHVTILENATLNEMKYEFNRLSNISDAYKGDISVCVYYSGHGIPDEKTGDAYLLPVDGYGTDISTGYSTRELYSFLGNLKSKKTMLFLDACFSGAAKDGNMLVSARGISIKTKELQPSGNLVVFSACQGDETAYPFKEKGHGLMTYYLLKKIKETNGEVLTGDLSEYITENVGKTAIVINGKSQTPTVSVSPEMQEIWKEQTLFE